MTTTPNSLRRAFGRHLRQIRKLRNLTQEKLGEKAEISYKYIGEMERGEVNPSFDILIRLIQVLEVSPDELFAFARPNKPKRIDFSSLKPTDIKTIKEALKIFRRLFG